jgi:hypothetical protein
MQARLNGARWAGFAGLALACVVLVATQIVGLAATLLASHEAFAAAAAASPLLQPAALRADAPKGFSPAERVDIENAIRLQIRAYVARDAQRAFARLAPSTQRFFGEPDRFLRALAQEIPTVLDARRFAFLGVEQVGRRTVQQVLITDSTEHEWLAEFQLERQTNGDWRVKGCVLQSTPGQQA